MILPDLPEQAPMLGSRSRSRLRAAALAVGLLFGWALLLVAALAASDTPANAGLPLLDGTSVPAKGGPSPMLTDGSAVQPPQQHPAPDREGGPDAYGYVFSDSRDPGGPNYSWIQGTERVADSAWQKVKQDGAAPWDDGVVTYTLPFNFNFYGINYSTLRLSTNGNIHFGPPNDYWPQASNACLPSTSPYVPKAMVAPLFYDFVVPLTTDLTPGGVYTDILGSAPNRIYLVEWRNVYQYDTPNVRATVELLLYENGDMVFQYDSFNGPGVTGSLGVVGIQNIDGSIGLPYTCYVDDLTPGRAIRYRFQQAVFLQPGDSWGGGAPGGTVTYNQSVLNRTGIDNSFNLSVQGRNWNTTVQPSSTGFVPRGSSVPVTVRVEIPPGTPLGAMDVATLTVSSNLPTPGAFTDTAVLTTTASTLGAEFVPDGQSQGGNYGQVVTYSLQLINRSGMANSFALTGSGATWSTTITPSLTSSMAPDASVPVTVSVLVPPSASLGAADAVTVTATGQQPSPGQFSGQTVLTTTAGLWERKANLPSGRSRAAAAGFAPTGRVYVVGGEFNNGNTNMPVLEYDPIADTWATRAYFPVGVSNAGAGVIGDAIYVPGGYSSVSSTVQSRLQVYYPLENRTDTITTDPMPEAIFGAGVAVAGGKLYVIGGADSTLAIKNTVYEYDPARPAGSRWQSKATMPTARVYLGAAAVDGIIYAVGGQYGGVLDHDTVEAYNPATDSWTTRASMSVPRGGLAVVGVDTSSPGCGGYLYAIGGGWSSYLSSAERYSPVTNSWEPVSSLSMGRRTLAAAYSPSTYALVAIGGWAGAYEVRTEAIRCSGALQPPTATPTVPATPSATPTGTTTPPTSTPVATTTACTVSFADVPPGNTFYPFVRCLACKDIVSGYACGGPGEPCNGNNDPYFRPSGNVTRGQIAKIVAMSANLNNPIPPGQQSFEDIDVGSTFYVYVERLADIGAMSGYPCGSIGEPCVGPQNRPYFRPNAGATRGQIAKIASESAGFHDVIPATQQTFEDVPPNSTFWAYIERLLLNRAGVMGGYPCGGVGEPCVAPNNRPYFRPSNSVTRGQTSKIVAGTFFPSCAASLR